MASQTMSLVVLALVVLANVFSGSLALIIGPTPDPALGKKCTLFQKITVPGSNCRAYEECQAGKGPCVKICAEGYTYVDKDVSFPGCYPEGPSCANAVQTCSVEGQVTAYPNNCQIFYRCQNGKNRIEYCPKGQVFNPKTGECGKTGCTLPAVCR